MSGDRSCDWAGDAVSPLGSRKKDEQLDVLCDVVKAVLDAGLDVENRSRSSGATPAASATAVSAVDTASTADKAVARVDRCGLQTAKQIR